MHYAGYEQTEATSASCVAHARRKFIEAQQQNQQSWLGN